MGIYQYLGENLLEASVYHYHEKCTTGFYFLGCRRLIREHSVEAIRNSLVKRPSIGIDKEEPVGTEDMVSLPSCTSLICKQNIVQSNSNGISSIEINDGTYSNHSTNQDQVELPTVVQVNQNTPIPNNSEQSS
jgi:hypothetical protein